MSQAEQSYEGKSALHMLPWAEMDAVGHVFSFGAVKHGENDWCGPNGPSANYCISAAMRHLSQHLQGNPIDESGQPHLIHAVSRLLMASHLERQEGTFQCAS